jgi:Bacterial inner membrane protein
MRAADWIGWVATAVFLASYTCKDQRRLRFTQAAAALLWVGYGVILQAIPIVVANLLVTAAAVYSAAVRPVDPAAPGAGIKPARDPDLSRIS